MRTRILVVDDEPAIPLLIARQLGDGHEVVAAADGLEGLAALEDVRPDVVICDLRMPGMDGLSLVRRLARARKAPPVIVTSGDCTLPELAEFLRLNVVDVLVKPFGAHEVRLAVARALAIGALQEDLRAGHDVPPDSSPLDGLAGSGELMIAAIQAARQAARSRSPMLIEGPSGSGKSRIAAAVHGLSDAAGGPLVELACGALAESLLEGELFGHVRGAFTGAVRDRPGVFERARGGTLVLDEVSVLSPHAQSRLAHALKAGEVTRLGETRGRPIEARIVATTQKALEPLVDGGEFREDLFHALAVLRVRMPAMRELGRADFEALASSLLERTSARLERKPPVLSPGFLERGARLPWQGNARELENVLERALLLGDGETIGPDALGDQDEVHAAGVTLPEGGLDLHATLRSIEHAYIHRALTRCAGNRERAAALLGLRRTALVEKLRRREAERDA